MLPVAARNLPNNSDDLVKALTQGLERIISLPPGRPAVMAIGTRYPALDNLIIDITDAALKDDFRPAKLLEQKHGGVTVTEFRFVGRPIRRQQAAVNFEISINDAKFDFHNDAQGFGLLVPADGRDGRLLIQGKQADFLAMILPQLRSVATQQGININNLECQLRGDSTQSLTFQARVQASKKVAGFNASTTIRAQGQAVIDQNLNLRLAGLSCQGDGMLGKMVASLLDGHLRELEKKSIPLTPYALGRLKLRDLKVHAADDLTIQATLGS